MKKKVFALNSGTCRSSKVPVGLLLSDQKKLFFLERRESFHQGTLSSFMDPLEKETFNADNIDVPWEGFHDPIKSILLYLLLSQSSWSNLLW